MANNEEKRPRICFISSGRSVYRGDVVTFHEENTGTLKTGKALALVGAILIQVGNRTYVCTPDKIWAILGDQSAGEVLG